MIKTIGRVSIACLLLGALEAHAIPLSFEFSAQVRGYGTMDGGVPVPAQFTDWSFIFTAPVSGAFTIETDTLGVPGYTDLNGVLTETVSVYDNPISQLALSIGDQQFNFFRSLQPNTWPIESSIAVLDLPAPSNDPTTNYDAYDLDVRFGPGVFSGAFSNLSASFALVRTERDPSVISSRDMVGNLVPSQNWSMYFTLYDTALPGRNYQLSAGVTELTQVSASVPEPGTAALLGLGLVLTIVGARRRQVS